MAYTIEFAESVKAHLEALTAKQRAIVLAKIEGQLTNQPLVETRNRKPSGPIPLHHGNSESVSCGCSTMWAKARRHLFGFWQWA